VLLVGGGRHLAAVRGLGIGHRAQFLQVGAGAVNWPDALARITAAVGRGQACVVLASGDPGLFGVVRSLRRAGLAVHASPGASSVAEAFGRIGRSWEDATVVSAHGRPAAPALAAARTLPKVAVLTGPQAPAELFVDALRAAGREVWVAERLGERDERVRRGADCSPPYTEPNIVLGLEIEDPSAGEARWRSGHDPVPDGWALAETEFEHRDSMVTKAEVRAVALASLAPRVGQTLWDVGAGSGSVAIECARFGADVLAVERDAEQCDRMRRNARRHGVRIEVVTGSAPAALGALRRPNAVFVGGGGAEVVEHIAGLADLRRVVVALAAVERVSPAMAAFRRNGFDVEGVQLQASRLSPLPDGTHRLSAANPVTLVAGVRA
jgi:precorrin-6Y C5,15-methyltransferase (decarboxylating)